MSHSDKPRDAGKPRDLWSLDNVRIYGVVSVVSVHALQVTERLHRSLGEPHALGILGLDVFFVLSGFLVWHVTRLRASSAPLFFLHRVTRVFPLYVILTALYAPFLRLSPLHLGHDSDLSLRNFILSAMLIPHTDANGSGVPLLGPGWTLVYDVYFFLLFTIALCFRRSQQLLAVTIIFLLPLVVHLVFHPTGIVIKTYTDPRAISFLLGVLAAHLFESKRTLPLKWAKLIAAISGFAYIGLTLEGVPYVRLGIAAWIAAAFIAVYATVSLQAAGSTWGKLPFAVIIGKWSYSIYLTQAFAIPVAVLLVPGPDAVKVLAAVVASIAAGAVAHEFIERPINRAMTIWERRHGLRGPSPLTIAP